MTKLTNEQIERIFGDIKGAKYVDIHAETKTAHPVFTTKEDVRHNVEDLEEILSLRQEVERLRNQWISVEDELPKIREQYVLISVGEKVLKAKYVGLETWNVFGSNKPVGFDYAPKWMPLPQPPKEQDHE